MDSTSSTRTKPKMNTKSASRQDHKFLDDMKYLPGAEGVCGWTMALVENCFPEYSKESTSSLHTISKSKSEEKISMMRPCIPRPSSPSQVDPFGPDHITDPRELTRRNRRRMGPKQEAAMQSSIGTEMTFANRDR